MSDHETTDAYHAVVARLNDRWRVIDSCQEHPYRQRILQYRASPKPDSWTTKPPYGTFCQTRAVLLREVRRKVKQLIDAQAWQALEALPDRDLGCPAVAKDMS